MQKDHSSLILIPLYFEIVSFLLSRINPFIGRLSDVRVRISILVYNLRSNSFSSATFI